MPTEEVENGTKDVVRKVEDFSERKENEHDFEDEVQKEPERKLGDCVSTREITEESVLVKINFSKPALVNREENAGEKKEKEIAEHFFTESKGSEDKYVK